MKVFLTTFIFLASLYLISRAELVGDNQEWVFHDGLHLFYKRTSANNAAINDGDKRSDIVLAEGEVVTDSRMNKTALALTLVTSHVRLGPRPNVRIMTFSRVLVVTRSAGKTTFREIVTQDSIKASPWRIHALVDEDDGDNSVKLIAVKALLGENGDFIKRVYREAHLSTISGEMKLEDTDLPVDEMGQPKVSVTPKAFK